jgi:transposase InsO family protein
MRMPYTSHPSIERVRREAVSLLETGWSVRAVARHFGYTHSAIVKWSARMRMLNHCAETIPTRSSKPHHHPNQLPNDIVQHILELRSERNQCAEILHWRLQTVGVVISLSSVKRVLRRAGISRFSRWKRWHQYPKRPMPEMPGMLIEIDTIHDGPHADRLYLYTTLDVCSRWGYAVPYLTIGAGRSVSFVRSAQTAAPFSFHTMQSDNGPEFTKHFTNQLGLLGIAHRHSRVRKPNDNAHLERFNRTIQEECLSRVPRSLTAYRREIPEWLRYYNTERPHMGLQMQTPMDVLKRFQGIDR